MSHALVEFWLILVMIVSLASLFAAMVVIYDEYWQTLSKIFRVGFLLLCLGLGVQTYRSLYFLQFGHYPVDHYVPTWIVKDVGFCLMIYSLFIKARRFNA
jgi:hypothetical protein